MHHLGVMDVFASLFLMYKSARIVEREDTARETVISISAIIFERFFFNFRIVLCKMKHVRSASSETNKK